MLGASSHQCQVQMINTGCSRRYRSMTQRRSSNARCALANIKAAGSREVNRRTARIYCFKRCAANALHSGQGKLYELVELKCIDEARTVVNNENTSKTSRYESRLCKEIPILRLKMTPQCSQLANVVQVQNKLNANQAASANQIKMPRKTVHFLNRSPADLHLANDDKIHCEDRDRKRKTFGRCLSKSFEKRDTQLKHFKVLTGKSRSLNKRDRLLLREYRLHKWVNFPETEIERRVAAENKLHNIEPKQLADDSNLATVQPNELSKTMQERALSNISKIEAALLSNCIPLQPESKNYDALLQKADSGIWCDFSYDKNSTLLKSSKACSDFPVTNSQCSDHGTQNNDAQSTSQTDDFNHRPLSNCNSDPTEKKQPILACSWYQNSKCISQTNIHSERGQKSLYKRNLNAVRDKVYSSPQLLTLRNGSFVQQLQDIEENSTALSDSRINNVKINNALENQAKDWRASLSLSEEASADATSFEKLYSNSIKRNSKLHNNPTVVSKQSLKEKSSLEESQLTKRHFVYLDKNHRVVYDKTTETQSPKRHKSVCSNTFERKSELPQHCAKPYSQNHSRFSCTNNCTDHSKTFPRKTSSNLEQSALTLTRHHSPCAKSNSIPQYGVFVKKPMETLNSRIYLTSEPGLIALKKGNDQTILLKCSCKNCTKTSKRKTSPIRNVAQNNLASTVRQRANSSKVSKSHKPHCKKVLSSRSNKSNFSSTTRLSKMAVWAMCFRCMDDDSSSSLSGGSDTCNDDDNDGDEGDDFAEHGGEVSCDEDSGGDDSGSESGGDESLNSAELYDDQNNMMDARQAFGDGDDSDGPASLDSECSDSLTELRSKTKRGGRSNDEDDEDDDDVTLDDDQFIDSWESLAIYEGE